MEYSFNVVAIGSSAGGLSPLREIISPLPAGLPAAIVVVSHLSTQYESRLNDVLDRDTALQVIKVTDRVKLEPGKVFVMPEGKMMTVSDGYLLLRDSLPAEKVNKAIDIFFESLAADAKNKSIGIILSGAGYDGIEGAKHIEHHNGLMIVQDPETAQFPLMPSALIANDHPDYILTPEDIVTKLLDHISPQAQK